MDEQVKLRLNAIEGAIQLLLRAALECAPDTPSGSEKDPMLKKWVELKKDLRVGLDHFTHTVET